jgi:peptide chain release factor 1
MSDMSKFKELSKIHKSLEKVVAKSRIYLGIKDDITEWDQAAQDPSDPEMQEAANQELKVLQKTKEEMEETLKILLIPKDPNDLKNVLLEIRGGTGGDEASIFVGDLHKMYRAYAETRGWKMSVISFTEGTMGGFKEITGYRVPRSRSYLRSHRSRYA